MPRPCCLRHIDVNPCAVYFKPAGIPVHMLAEVVLTLDELESLRLADLNGLYQEQAAGPFFFEIIQRKGDQGFGAGNFRALFESIERAQQAQLTASRG